MKTPTNTTEEAKTEGGALMLLAEQMFGGGRAIENQEARGQTELVNSEVLPTETRDKPEWYAKIGVVLGEPVASDPMFRAATLPPGWKKVPTDHSMWSKVIDDKGRERIAIFYKAAFYDRSAHMRLVPRFTVRTNYVKAGTGEQWNWRGDGDAIVQVLDGGRVVFTQEPVAYRRGESTDYEASDKGHKVAAAWLNERWPNPENDPTLHWD